MSPHLPAPIGQLVDVGGYRLHLHGMGDGGPAVVFEAGGIGWSLDWHRVQADVAQFTRACAYDRAGLGWSEPGPKPRTSRQIAAELHALLHRANIPPPYVLVGASFGGHTARVFANLHPDEVAGIVLLDARHEDMDARMPPAWRRQEAAGKGMYQALLLTSRLGALPLLGRLMGDKAAPPALAHLPPELRETYLTVGFQTHCLQANLDEFAAAAESDTQLRATGVLGDLPLTVIRHGIPSLFAGMPAGQRPRAEQAWQELQVTLAGLSTRGQLLVAHSSGHAIHLDQPRMVVDAIRDMVNAIRDRMPRAP